MDRKNIYFISDIHLGLLPDEEEYRRERLLVDLLYSIKDDAEALYIVGDLYDYWFEYRRVIQKQFFRTLTAIQDLVEAGVKVVYVIGNHDFLHRDLYRNVIGVELVDVSLKREYFGKRFYIAHGDDYVQNDTGYRILKKILRNRFMQGLFGLVHPDLGIYIAGGTSKKSRAYTNDKEYGEKDGLLASASGIINLGYDFVVFGHLHQRQYVKMGNGYYVNLGSWLEQPCYGVFNGHSFEIIDWKGK